MDDDDYFDRIKAQWAENERQRAFDKRLAVVYLLVQATLIGLCLLMIAAALSQS